MDTDGPFLVETGGALNIRYRGRLLYPERGPASLPERAAAACETGPSRLHLLSSPGLWYGVATLLSRLDEGSAVLCVEADPLLARLSRERMPPALASHPRLAFVDSADPARLFREACRLGRFRRCLPLKLSGGAAFNENDYARAAASLQAEFAAFWRSKAALLSMGRLWARNIFRNLARIDEIAPSLPALAEGGAIVCGAGPSLEARLPFISGARDRLSVLACDTALPILLDAGIEPDLVICLEGQAHNLPDFIPAAGRGIALMADLSSHPATFGALAGARHLSLVRIAPGPFMDRLAALSLPFLPCPPLGSVGVHAVHVARRLHAGPLFAVGLDFAFERGKSHARGAPSLRSELASMTRLSRWPRQAAGPFRPGVRAMDNSASPAALLTDPVLTAYAALLADEAASPGPAILDLRGRGLPIGATPVQEPEAMKILRGYPRRPSASIMGGPTRFSGLARRFLEAELGRIDAMLDVMKGRRGSGRAELAALAAEADYVLWPLADDGRAGEMPQDLANRLLVEAEYWRWKLGEALETLSETSRS